MPLDSLELAARRALHRAGALLGALAASRDPAWHHLGARAHERLETAALWWGPDVALREEPPELADPGDADALLIALQRLTREIEDATEGLEEADPVRFSGGVQAGSLAFAIVSDIAGRLRRHQSLS